MKIALCALAITLSCAGGTLAQDSVTLFAAGSLKAAMTDIADAFEAEGNAKVVRVFGPSGLLRERIEKGEPAQVFASANMRHPEALSEDGRAGDVVMFARNQLCALAQPELSVETTNLLDVILDAETRLGTSTPKADPSGDYAWELFAKAENLKAGASTVLGAKALQLTGGPNSAIPPEGINPYGWVMAKNRADIFLTYCTNAVLAKREVPDLQIIDLPDALSVGANYGLTLITDAPETAAQLAGYILSEKGQSILAGYGFNAP